MQPSDSFLSRRDLLTASAATGAAALVGTAMAGNDPKPLQPTSPNATTSGALTFETLVGAPGIDVSKGRLKQSVCRWCFGKMSVEDLAAAAKQIGLVAIDLLKPNDFETVKKHGLVCSMVSSHKLEDGLCDPKHWDAALESINEMIEATAKEGWRNVICFSGNARGIDRKTGLKNCAEALKKVVPVAEKAGVILNMELLNSKVDHPDYMCDNSTWGVELCKEVGSHHFKLLYDIYHMQIMEGDIIRTIERDHQFFGHYHTAGNPGRHELDETQELFYPPIAKAIAETGFDGFFAHEFIPTRDPLAGLEAAAKLCTV
ncbi:MAG: TIM barrel protein [Planctomycetaceae bacterium]